MLGRWEQLFWVDWEAMRTRSVKMRRVGVEVGIAGRGEVGVGIVGDEDLDEGRRLVKVLDDAVCPCEMR